MPFDSNKYISISDVVDCLSGSGTSSSTGRSLDRARDGTSGTFGSYANNEEFKVMAYAGVLKCVDEIRRVVEIKFESCPSIRAFAKKTNSAEGALVLSVLSSYYRWYLKSTERGLVEVYRLMQKLDPSLPDPDHNEDSLSQSFRMGKTKKAREKAAKLLKDSLLVMDTWIKNWNENIQKAEKRKGK